MLHRQQRYQGGHIGPVQGTDIAVVDPAKRARQIADERIRLFFLQDAVQSFHGIRYLHILALLGSGSVGFVTWLMAGTDVHRILLWCSIIFAIEAAITGINHAFQRRDPDKLTLRQWASITTVIIGCNGMSWSFGPVFLHVDNVPISVLAPVWGIVNIMAAAVASGALYAPAMVALVTGATLPAMIWLGSFQGGLELAVAVCIGVSLPFLLAIGYFSVNEAGEAIAARLTIADLLEVQTQQTNQIRDAHLERNRFFSAASHDLRQPLHAMGFYVSLLPRAASSKERDEILSRLSECASGLNRQFNAIMGVAETDAAVEAASIRPTRLQEILDRLSINFKPDTELKSLAFRVMPTTLWVDVAPELLERVLANLLSNAIKYTPAGGVLLGVRRHNGYAEIQVVDTGMGIAKRDVPLIFQDFFQIANPERNRDKGFGLGLGIVRRLCLGMNWLLTVKSKVGRGTIFSVRVPLAAAESKATANDRSVEAATETSVNTASVIFVDDDPLVRDAMRRLLSDWNFSVDLCQTGAEAIDILRGGPAEKRWHVLLDYRLAGNEDGLNLADSMRAQFGNRIQLTMMSAETNEQLMEGAQSRGITLLRKPVKPIRLRAALTAGVSPDA